MTSNSLPRRILLVAGISGATGVLLGSFGAHGLDDFLSARGLEEAVLLKRLEQFDTGVRYHLIHSVALLALAAVAIHSTTQSLARCLNWVFWLFLLGLLLFSGSLYLLVLTNTPKFGAITPLGGLCWIAGWLLLAVLCRAGKSDE